jgi:ribosomal protein S12 methylthiotransferase
MKAAPASPARIGIVSLGCPKALVDSERIVTRLRAEGYELSPDYRGADLVVVNTCGFIDAAVEESLEAIGEALEENGKVVVTGCLGAREELVRKAHPRVLAVTGPHAAQQVLEAVHRHSPPRHDPYTSLISPAGLKLTPRHYAYLKISEGCNHRCSFCIIPSLRGDLVSRPIDEVLDEARALVEAGTRELLVISQDTSAYGVDRHFRTGFWNGRPLRTQITALAGALGELGAWVRLHYVYPYPHVDQLIPLMAEGKLLPYLDIPLQHASRPILKAMKRPADSEDALARIRAWRGICPDLTLRSTFIVGFPGETEEDFRRLLGFLEQAQLDRVGCFTYSPVEGAAANELPDPVPEAVKQERQARLMELQAGISVERLAGKIGRRLQVLVDAVDEQGAVARSFADAPEIDGEVYIENGQHLQVGELCEVTVTGASEHDLWGDVADRANPGL